MNTKIQSSINKTRALIEKINPHMIVCCYSTGNDSATMSHICMTANLASTLFFVDTGTGVDEEDGKTSVLNVANEYANKHSWPLIIEKTPISYEDNVLKNGFPGPPQHSVMFGYLKGRAFRLLKKHHAPRKKLVLLTGLRQSESEQRKKKSTFYRQEGQYHWINPIFKWSKRDCFQYLKANNVYTSPIAALLGMSGECLCGSYAGDGELEMIKQFFPVTGKRIQDLESRARENGFNWGYNGGPPKNNKADTAIRRGQILFPGFDFICNNCQVQNSEAMLS